MNKPYIASIVGLVALLLAATPWQQVRASVDDFTMSEFEAHYYVSRDTNHVSHLRVEERIVAEFPSYDQNHGILRAIPKTYEGHNVNLKINSVKSSSGQAWPYNTSSENDNLVLKIGDPDRYVHGQQTYAINYRLSHATTKPTGHDALIWDVNGDNWRQPFGSVVAHIHLPADLATALQPDQGRCFTGPRGSTAQNCTIQTKTETAETIVTVATTQALQAGETLTYELGFAPGTFAAYRLPTSELLKLLALILGLGVLPVLTAAYVMLRRWWRYGRDPEGRGTIVPEYLPPKQLSVLGASGLLTEGFQPKAISAQIIDLAVRHYLRIYEIKQDRLFKDKITYEVELAREPHDLRPDEQKVINLLFGQNEATSSASRVKLDDLKHKLHKQASDLGEIVNQQLATDGYFRAAPDKARNPYIFAGIALIIIGAFTASLSLFALGISLAGIIVLAIGYAMPARTAQGVEARDHLLGLKHYMKLAETDRLRALQSPHGDLTEKINTANQLQLVKLYERLLPYAMLFGIEQDWAKEFAHLYEKPPEWYHSSGTFQGAYFASSLHNFGAASTASFSPPSSSSGGGSAGGGGGGGGGGGW